MKNYLIYALFGISDQGIVERCLNIVNQSCPPSREKALQIVSETYGIIPLDVSVKEN